MSQIPRPILVIVIIALGGSALFGLSSGFMAAAGKRQGIARDSDLPPLPPTGPVVDAKPFDPSAPPPPPVLTPEEAAAKKAAADKAKADEDKKKADAAALAASAPAEAKPEQPLAPGAIDGPPPPTPEQAAPNLY